ncbi:hypothetical protein [Hymenobacter coccineus]|uniref:hypothetical protein n=1 Tax=Hymenobacter coccineus TaxID=1908235 RepID=UPI000F78B7C5|nr:hypothetical protein [Hymenobacter coccineus]
MADKTPNSEMTDYIKNISQEQLHPFPAADLVPIATGQQLPAPAPAVAPVVPELPELTPSTSAAPASPQLRPLAYFTTPAQQVTKKQSVYLPVELHRALATVVNLPGVEVSLSDLLANIVQAWRDDHRAEVRKRYREGEKGI